jgi:hypothetical protein
MLCERCGWTAPHGPAPERGGRLCPADHAVLERDGFCPTGRGYPLGMPCPFACPICRGMLDWSGGCESCHGTSTSGRESWTFPGDRYDCYDDNGQPIGDGRHWVKTDGPRAACRPEENLMHAQEIQRILGKSALVAPPDWPKRRRSR